MVPGTSALIANGGNRTIGFSIRPEQGQWQNSSLDSGQNREYAFGTARFEIAIRSDGNKMVQKVLDCGAKYALFFNAGQASWDIEPAENF